MINNFKTFNEGKVYLTSKLEFISSKDTSEKRRMYITSSNLDIMIADTDEIITKYFKSL